MAIDFGSGQWLEQLPAIGVKRVEHVILTHHHADQCAGLEGRDDWPFAIHAPDGEKPFLSPEGIEAIRKRRLAGNPFPPSYCLLDRGLANVQCDLGPGSRELLWGPTRVRFIATPGHSPKALSAILDWRGKQVVFCGDAAHAGATVWQPYCLEWHHSNADGPLAAWEGVRNLASIAIDLLCPSHGPAIADHPRKMLAELAKKLMKFYEAKGNICPGEPDRYVPVETMAPQIKKVLPSLYQYGMNGYLLLSQSGEALVVDPQRNAHKWLEDLLDRLGRPAVAAAIASHYHCDHTDGFTLLKERFGARICLHPWLAEVLGDHRRHDMIWPSEMDTRADELLPERGEWRWNEYVFQVAPFPGQTRWHAAYQTAIDGQKVFFGGDNFQPCSRWNGTGGFCSINDSRFRDGFIASAQLVLDWKPDLLCNGHGTFFRFSPSQFHKIQKWALKAEKAVVDLCPTGDLEEDYYIHHPGGLAPHPSRHGNAGI